MLQRVVGGVNLTELVSRVHSVSPDHGCMLWHACFTPYSKLYQLPNKCTLESAALHFFVCPYRWHTTALQLHGWDIEMG